MRKSVCSIVVALVVVFGAVCLLQAASLDDAKGLAEKAAAYIKTNGKDKGLSEINNPKGQFVKGDLYVTVTDFDGRLLAHPMQPQLVNLAQNPATVKDATGKLFVMENTQVAKTKGSGWVTFSWTNPATKKVQPGKYWVQRVEGMDMYTMCGQFQ
jgi:cytochrome c